ncbi:Glycosyltransferase involved in cell wall bisynthesis [Rhizobiales bacterium GAS188]|jgi:dolichol-phosphate mannosyltransferase|nr:Glycosyltransferase involved in cell wall bisynthesis [Rhizobiales bacterium GAS188]
MAAEARRAAAIASGLRQRVVRLAEAVRSLRRDSLPSFGSLVAAILLIVAVGLVFDAPIAAAMRHLPHRLVNVFAQVTILGEGWVVMLPAGLIALWFARVSLVASTRREAARALLHADRALLVLAAVVVPSVVTTLVKHVIGRLRPRYFESLGAFHFEPLSLAASKASFPSGHATTIAALAVAVGVVEPRWRRVAAILVAVIFASRIAVEAHYVSDVVAGGLIGMAGAHLVLRLFAQARIALTVDRDGKPARRGIFRGRPATGVPALLAADAIRGAGEAAMPPQNQIAGEAPAQPRLSVVVPMRNEAENAGPLIAEIEDACREVAPFELICVDDGSSDATAERLVELGRTRPHLRVLRHATSCGQSAAVRSGVRAARAPIVATLDGDGQNDPAFIPKLVAALEAGGGSTGLVAGQRLGRKDTGFKKLQSRIANGVRSNVLRDGTRDTGCGLKAFRRDVFLALPYFDGLHRFLPALMRREGYQVALVDVVDRARRAGHSNYGMFDRLWVGILDLAGVWWLIRRRRRVPAVSELQKDA